MIQDHINEEIIQPQVCVKVNSVKDKRNYKIHNFKMIRKYSQKFGYDLLELNNFLAHFGFYTVGTISLASLFRILYIIMAFNILQDLWLSSEAVDAQAQRLNALEESHYLYPVDMKSVLTNGALRNVICRNF